MESTVAFSWLAILVVFAIGALLLFAAVMVVSVFLSRRREGDGGLIPCHDCGQFVSPTQPTCPHCGCRAA